MASRRRLRSRHACMAPERAEPAAWVITEDAASCSTPRAAAEAAAAAAAAAEAAADDDDDDTPGRCAVVARRE